MTFTTELLRLMAQRELNQRELAELLECSPVYVHMMLTGQRNPSSRIRAALRVLAPGVFDFGFWGESSK